MIQTIDDLVENLYEFNSYKDSENADEQNFFHKTIKSGWNFVCATVENEYMFCPSRFIGYESNSMAKHEQKRKRKGQGGLDGTKTSATIKKVLGSAPSFDEEIEANFITMCEELGIHPDKRDRTYWKIDVARSILEFIGSSKTESEFIDGNGNFIEGAARQIWVNRYERSAAARNECLRHYGYKCSICDFDFEKVYGDIGKQYIHVHHIVPISRLGKDYNIDPVKDLRPVCPNCHAMLHTAHPPHTIKDIKDVLVKI